MDRKVENPCFSIQLNSRSLKKFCREVMKLLRQEGISAEPVDTELHVSIAYINGLLNEKEILHIVREIQKQYRSFSLSAEEGLLKACRFTILPGVSTPFDYLALELETPWLTKINKLFIEKNLPVRHFSEGFKSHISLLKIPKGDLSKEKTSRFIRELNASFFAARALGSVFYWKGHTLAVFEKNSNSPRQTPRVCFKRRLRTAA